MSTACLRPVLVSAIAPISLTAPLRLRTLLAIGCALWLTACAHTAEPPTRTEQGLSSVATPATTETSRPASAGATEVAPLRRPSPAVSTSQATPNAAHMLPPDAQVLAQAPSPWQEAVLAYARELDRSQAWPEGWAERWLTQAEHDNDAVRLMTPAPTGSAKNWKAYRSRFIEPIRIRAGVAFWQEQADALTEAERRYGIPPWLVVGIIGVETLYGRHTGQHRVLDVLATLAFDFPASHPRAAERQAFFRDELKALLELSHQQGVAPTAWRGSYAGAMGMPQFMPSNWTRFGVDLNGDGRLDLQNSPGDAIASVARYLNAHGWTPGMPTHYAAHFDHRRLDLDRLLAPDILPSFTVQQLQQLGVKTNQRLRQHSGLLALIELENGARTPSYVIGTQNFYTVTRYNWSSYYAMAVIELAEAVAREMQSKP